MTETLLQIAPFVTAHHFSSSLQIRIIGSYGARTRHDLPDVIDLAAMGKFDVAAPVTRRYALEDAGEAYAALDRGEIDGRAIVVMD